MDFHFTASAFGSWDSSSGVENLPPAANSPGVCNLSTAKNVRFTKQGGITNRPGRSDIADLGTGAMVKDIETLKTIGVMFTRSGTGIYQSVDGETWYTIGLTRTAAASEFIFPHERDVFITNETDNYTRATASRVASINSVAGTFSVTTGHGDAFTSGTVYIRGTAVTGGTLSTDTFTGCSGLTGSMAIGDIVTQTSEPSGAPKGSCIAELEGSALVARGATISASLPSNDQEPELFYDFDLADGATAKRMSSDVTAMKTGLGVVLIGMKDGIDVASGFQIDSGALLTTPLSRVHSIPGPRCITEMDREFAVLTSDGRILPAMNYDTGFQLVEDPNNPRNNMDYAVQSYIQDNKSSDNSENHIHYDPATRELSATIKLKTGITSEFVLRRDIGAWSFDTGKNCACKTNFNGSVFGGSDSDAMIHLLNDSRTDGGVPITSHIVTGQFRLGRKAVTADWLRLTFGGLLSAVGRFYFSIYVDGVRVERKLVTASDLIAKKLMSLTAGVPIGGGQIGAKEIGSGGAAIEAFKFEYPYEFMSEGETAQIEWEVVDEGTALELRYFSLEGEHDNELLLTHS